MLDKYKDYFLAGPTGASIIDLAAEYGNHAFVKTLFQLFSELLKFDLAALCEGKIPDPNTKRVWPTKALTKSASHGKYDVFKFLANFCPVENLNLLHTCFHGTYGEALEHVERKLDISWLLLSKNKELLYESESGASSPFLATDSHPLLISFLLESGADIRSTNSAYPKGNLIHSAVRYMNSADFYKLCTDVVTKYNAPDLFLTTPNWSNPWHYIIEMRVPVDTMKFILEIPGVSANDNILSTKISILQQALATKLSLEHIKLLIEKGADMYHKDRNGLNLFHSFFFL